MDNMWVLPVDMDSNDLKEGIKASQFEFTESTTNFLKDQLTVRPPHLGDALQQADHYRLEIRLERASIPHN
jgi:extradiol dioxygenase family protein